MIAGPTPDELAVRQLPLGVVRLPDTHPRAHEGVAEVYAQLILHPAGPILVDTGPGRGNAVIDELYRPTVVAIDTALQKVGFEVADVVAVVNTHLHYDHCGQNRAVPEAMFWVQSDEVEAAKQPGYTVAEWAAIPEGRLRRLDGDGVVADGVSVLATPGHTPGHQSVVVDGADGPIVIAGQCCYTVDDFETGVVSADNLHEPSSAAAAQASLDRLRSVAPVEVHLSHDRRVLGRLST